MDMDMDMSSGAPFTPLNDSGVDFSNETQAFNFLQDVLDDSYFQIVSVQYTRYFWYGIVVMIGIATTCNLICVVLLRAR
jgi:ferric-chelate reductase